MTETIRIYMNKLSTRGKNTYGLLLRFHMCGLHWLLHYRGDAPLVIYHADDVLQIDGDVYCPIASNLCPARNTDDFAYDSYLFKTEDALDFLNTMLYEDMDLEYVPDEFSNYETNNDDDYEIYYEGENGAAFELLKNKVDKLERILASDLVKLNE